MNKKVLVLGVLIVVCIVICLVWWGSKNKLKDDDTQNTLESNRTETSEAKAGNYTLQYGIYKSDLPEGTLLGGTYEIKADGTFVYKNTWKSAQTDEEHVDNDTGTYEIFYSEDMEKNTWIIKFNYSNNDDGLGFTAFDIVDNNKFSARQYSNTFTLQN